jgi:hypothetical protein
MAKRLAASVQTAEGACLSVAELSAGSLRLRFTPPIRVRPEFTDDLCTFTYPPLGIVAYASTRAEAEAAFLDELAWLWETYVQVDESTLAEDAIELRATLLEMVKEEGS